MSAGCVAPWDRGRPCYTELSGAIQASIAPRALECGEDAPVGAELDTVLGERGAEEIAEELLPARAIVGRHPDVGVEVEAVELSRL